MKMLKKIARARECGIYFFMFFKLEFSYYFNITKKPILDNIKKRGNEIQRLLSDHSRKGLLLSMKKNSNPM